MTPYFHLLTCVRPTYAWSNLFISHWPLYRACGSSHSRIVCKNTMIYVTHYWSNSAYHFILSEILPKCLCIGRHVMWVIWIKQRQASHRLKHVLAAISTIPTAGWDHLLNDMYHRWWAHTDKIRHQEMYSFQWLKLEAQKSQSFLLKLSIFVLWFYCFS